MPKVSLIISAYNIEKYIKKCLQSLISQTFKDIEIIVVNDGSTDNTLNEITQIMKGDTRIIIINQANKGVMRAREVGFENAKGEYLLFVDGDDWLAKNAVEILYEKARLKDYDIVCYKFYFTDGNDIKKSSNKDINYQLLVGDHFLKMIMTSKINPSLWSKLIKRSFILNNNIAFPNGIAKAQDLAFACSLGMYNPKACLTDEYLYFYFTSRNTSTTNSISPKLLDVEKATLFIKRQLKSNNMYKENKEEYEFLAFIHNLWVNRDMIYNNKNHLSKTLYNNWKGMDISITQNRYFRKLMMDEEFKVRIISGVLVRSYSLGSLVYKLYNLYTFLIRRSRLIN